MSFISDLIMRLKTDRAADVLAVMVAIIMIVLIAVIIAYIRSPFSFPYMSIECDVTGKRNLIREDIIDEALLDPDITSEISEHEDYIKDWQKWCRKRIEKSPFKRRRKKQYKRSIPSKDKIYRFRLYRRRKKYTKSADRRYHYHYTRQIPAGEFTAGIGELKLRYRKLRKAGFKGTMGELERKKQRRLMTPALRKIVMVRDDYTCQICGKYMPDGVGIEIDHIIPVAKGGKTTVDNLQVLCSDCNKKKSDKL